MYHFSDSDSKDSDEGIRFKTDSIRNKQAEAISNKTKKYDRKSDYRRSRSKSPSRNSRDEPSRYSRSRHDDRRNRSHRKDRRRSSSSSADEHKKINKKSREVGRDRSDSRKKSSNDSLKKKESSNSEIAILGPVLPPDLKNKPSLIGGKEELFTEPISDDSQGFEDSEESKTGPSSFITKTTSSIGPVLPKESKEKSDEKIDEKASSIGPALPPHLTKNTQEINDNIGPALPPHLKKNSEDKTKTKKSIGPTLPPHLRQKFAEDAATTPDASVENEASEDEDFYGPVPEGLKITKAHVALEERALQLKMDQLDPEDDKQPAREEWMVELPAARTGNFGLGPRQFRGKAGPDLSDRSSWTDTPEDKAKKKEGKIEKKVDLQKEAELMEISKRDKEQESISKKHKKEKNSLLEIHRKKMKKEKKDESGPSERRPFSREVDLQVNKFDDAQKKAVLKKAQLLDTRFSRGQSKFL